MSKHVFLSLHQKRDGDPLGEHALEGLLKLELYLPQNSHDGHFVLNLYVRERYIGMANIVWEGTLEYIDPLIGHYFLGSAFVDDVDVIDDAIPDEELRKIIIECFRRSNIAFHQEVRKPDEIRDFIIAMARLN